MLEQQQARGGCSANVIHVVEKGSKQEERCLQGEREGERCGGDSLRTLIIQALCDSTV